MADLLSRQPLFEGSASLFTDEKITNARVKINEWLTECQCFGPANKSDAIGKQISAKVAQIQELIVNSSTELLDEFLDNILAFSYYAAMEARKGVVGFIEEASKTKIECAPRMIPILSHLLKDESPHVIKRVIQACTAVYKSFLMWLCTLEDIPESVETAWNTLSSMKAETLDLIDHLNDGIRTRAIAFLEMVVILQSFAEEDSIKLENDFSLDDVPLTLKIAKRRKLEDEANNIFDVLLKFFRASHISSSNLTTCLRTLCNIAKLRPKMMPQVVDAIIEVNANFPPTLTDTQVNSMRKNLKLQCLNILRLPSSFPLQSTLVEILKDLGASNNEIMRAVPRISKAEHQKRSKRVNTMQSQQVSKRFKIDQTGEPKKVIDDNQSKAKKINEDAIIKSLENLDNTVNLVIGTLPQLPETIPNNFLSNYTPIVGVSDAQLIKRIASKLSEDMTEAKLGPGAKLLTSIVTESMEIDGDEDDDDEPMMQLKPMNLDVEDIENRKDDAAKKLRETLERVKGEQAIIPRMKQRVKTLKLQEITKPLSKTIKESFQLDAIRRILRSETQSKCGGVTAKRRQILRAIAATNTNDVRSIILEYIMDDIKNRLDLAFAWLYEEYSVFREYLRHIYIKSEHKPDYLYNTLLDELISGIIDTADIKDKNALLRRVYLDSPIISNDALNKLIAMCEMDEFSEMAMELLRDMIYLKPIKCATYLQIILRFTVHNNVQIRDIAITNALLIYDKHKKFNIVIEEHATTWFNFLENEEPSGEIFSPLYGRSEILLNWNEDMAKSCLSLFLALLPSQPSMLQKLNKLYIKTTPYMKRLILKTIEIPIKILDPEEPDLLFLIESGLKGSETLITRIIQILTEKSLIPNPTLVSKVRELYHSKVSDVRLLIPVLNGLSKQEILTALPKLLKLSPAVVKEVFNKLLGIGISSIQAREISSQLPIGPAELLVALHTVDTSKVELKFVVKATSICLAEKEIFTQDVMIVVLQQLIEIIPLPTLLMRTVIQSITSYPRMSNFVVNLLQKLILKQVWKHKVVWEGFLKCCQRLKPQSLPCLLQLPPAQLIDALNSCPDLREPLNEHANSMIEKKAGSVSQHILDILSGKCEDVFITDIAGVIAPENIKKEVIDEGPSEISTISQPLPPGEDL